MPKRYEDEIRDILRGMDRFPDDGPPVRRRRRWQMPSFPSFRSLDAQRIMGGALILMLFSWVLSFSRSFGYGYSARLAGYASLASLVLFVLAIVLYLRRGSFGGGASSEPRWRGQVINMPRRGGPLTGLGFWWRRQMARFQRRSGPRRSGPRGRDSFQW